MALHNDDLMVVQKHDGANEIRKATIQQLSEFLQTTESVNYKGLANFSQAGEEPATRFQGDLYINNGPADGTFAWPAGNGQSITVVQPGDRAIWNQDENDWDLIQSGAGDVGVTEITGSIPIVVENGDSESPNITVNDASTSAKGVVTLASAQDVTDGSAGVVVTADQLKITNDNLAGAIGGGVTSINAQDPLEVLTDGSEGSSVNAPVLKIKVAAVGQQGSVAKYDATTTVGDPSGGSDGAGDGGYAGWLGTLDAAGYVTFKAVGENFVWADFSGLEDA